MQDVRRGSRALGRSGIAGAALLLASAIAPAALAQDLPDRRPLSAPRIRPVQRDAADEAQKALLGDGTRPVLNVTATVANHPKLAEAWLTFARYVLSENNTLPPRERELLILRVGWLCQAEYEWGQHSRVARRVGLTDEEIVRVSKGPDAPGWTEHERALLRATDELRRDAFIHDQTWAKLAETYTRQQLMDVVFTVGEYNMVSMALRTFGVEREEGVEGFPE